MRMKVALVSLDSLWEDKAGNLELCRERVARAAALGADLVAFPEMTLTGFTMNATSAAEPAGESLRVWVLAAAAAEHRVHVAFGVVLEGEQRPRNTLVVVDREGGERARYAKVHPFSRAGEHVHYERGLDAVVVDLGGVRLGLSICYDLRFPEFYAAMAQSCDALLVAASWPAARIEHWLTLLRARAIEAQCCVLGVNRTGRDGAGVEHPASSRAFGPGGESLAPVAADGDIELFAVDAGAVREYRQSFPVLQDRVPSIYARPPKLL
jgi:omega-amidase